MKSLTAIIKVTMGCNLGCDYCYSVLPGLQPVMAPAVLERTVSQLLATADESAFFIWHGGEPLLAGLDFYREVVRLQAAHRGDGQRITNGLQTNATPVTPASARFLFEAGFKVGVSIDGPEQVHDRFRVFAGGRPSFRRVMRGVEHLRAAGFDCGASCVVTKPSLPHAEAIYRFFVAEGFPRIDFLPCFSNSNNPHAVPYAPTADEYADFMMRVFDLWWAEEEPPLRVRYFDNALRALAGEEARMCKLRADCLGHITIFQDGTVGPCDELPRRPEWMFGNLMEHDLPDLLRSAALRRLDAMWADGRAGNGLHVMNGLCHHCGEEYLDAEVQAADRIFAHIAAAMNAVGVETRPLYTVSAASRLPAVV